MGGGDWRLIPGPGAGVLARFGPTVLLLERGNDPAAAELIAAVREAEPDAVIDALFQVARKHGSAQVTAFCALVDSGGQRTLAIHGEMKAVAVVNASAVRFAGRGAGSRVEESIPEGTTQVGAGGRQPDPATSAFFDLVEGVVPAGSFLFALEGAAAVAEPEEAVAPAPEIEAEIAAEPAPVLVEVESEPSPAAAEADPDMTRHMGEAVVEEAPAAATALVEPAAPPEPVVEPEPPAAPPPPPHPTILAAPVADVRQALTMAYQAISAAPEHAQPPEVDGRLCAMGHLNHPAATECWICGDAVTTQVGRGPRPPLGRLTTKDQRSFIVDGDFVVGRRPEQAADVASGRARPIATPNEQTSVSRVHAEIRLQDWDVLVVDLGSANGTYYLPPGGQWMRLEPNQPVAITKGTSLTLGGFEMLLESV